MFYIFCDAPGNHVHGQQVLVSVGGIVVTHDLDSIRRIADRIVMLDKGYVRFDGTLEDALQCDLPLVKNFFARASSEGHAGVDSLWDNLTGDR